MVLRFKEEDEKMVLRFKEEDDCFSVENDGFQVLTTISPRGTHLKNSEKLKNGLKEKFLKNSQFCFIKKILSQKQKFPFIFIGFQN